VTTRSGSPLTLNLHPEEATTLTKPPPEGTPLVILPITNQTTELPLLIQIKMGPLLT
jgi:hypothetical protein